MYLLIAQQRKKEGKIGTQFSNYCNLLAKLLRNRGFYIIWKNTSKTTPVQLELAFASIDLKDFFQPLLEIRGFMVMLKRFFSFRLKLTPKPKKNQN